MTAKVPLNLIVKALAEMREDKKMFGLDGACPAAIEPGTEGSKLLLVTGENAGGKSLVCRFLSQILSAKAKRAKSELEVMRIGMDLRTAGGMAKAFIFGDENWESTGQITVKSVLGAFSTSEKRTGPHIICLDEPDVGLSEGYQAAVGDALASYAGNLPEQAAGFIVVTHSRLIASRLAALNPHMVRVGDDLRPTMQWLAEGPLPRTIEDLEGLQKKAHQRFLKVTALINERQRERAKSGSRHAP